MLTFYFMDHAQPG